MEANVHTAREILHSTNQFLVPFFQRFYSWRREHWETLQSDIWQLLESESQDRHFLGPVVCHSTNSVPVEVPAFQLIDGQQRLTTLTMVLAALRDVAKAKGFTKLATRIHEECLVHRHEDDLKRYKVVPRIGDREALIAIVDEQPKDEFRKLGITRCWKYFRNFITRLATSSNGEELLKRLYAVVSAQLSFVVITITNENPYEIFESLNSTGLELEESDLIRNYIFMKVDLDKQEKFFNQYWQPFETKFDETDEFPEIGRTVFYRAYLMKNGRYVNKGATFVDFKSRFDSKEETPESQVNDLNQILDLYSTIVRPTSAKDKDLSNILSEIDSLDISTAYPLVLNLLERNANGQLSKDDLTLCLNDLCSFVIRRAICEESTRSYGKIFSDAIGAIKEDPTEDLRKYWASKRWPDDKTFGERLQSFSIYRREPQKLFLILQRLEQKLNPKETINPDELTIEHVMPQTINNSKNGKKWKEMLGEEWGDIQEEWLDTIGNLTLTGYNSGLGNRPFEEKRDELAKSNLALNRTISKCDQWTPAEMAQRAKKIGQQIIELWQKTISDDYVPEPIEKEKPNYKVRRREYWKQLSLILEDRKLPQPIEITETTSIDFPVGIDHVSLYAWFNRNRAEISIGMNFQRRAGKKLFKALHNEKKKAEKEFGEYLVWQSSGIQVILPDSRIVEEDDWLDHHEWMADKLERFYSVIIPQVKAIVESNEST
ncbi:MAG: DUF4268 domain-containing protein [Planctomycetota bacterium]